MIIILFKVIYVFISDIGLLRIGTCLILVVLLGFGVDGFSITNRMMIIISWIIIMTSRMIRVHYFYIEVEVFVSIILYSSCLLWFENLLIYVIIVRH